jgi:hypothetical protein
MVMMQVRNQRALALGRRRQKRDQEMDDGARSWPALIKHTADRAGGLQGDARYGDHQTKLDAVQGLFFGGSAAFLARRSVLEDAR